MKWFCIVVIICLLGILPSRADYQINLDDKQNEYGISSKLVDQLEDPFASYTIDQVSSKTFSGKFKPSGENMLRNLNRESAYWLRFKIINKTDKHQQWLIESFNFRINEISFFLQTKGGFEEVIQGDMYPFRNRSISHKNFEFLLPNSSDTLICYLRVKTKQHASFELFIRRFDHFTSYAISEYFLLGIFYGTIGIVAMSSLFLLLSFRKIVFLYYSLFLAGFAVFFMCQDGTGFQYLWPNYPILNAYSIQISRLLMLIPYIFYFCDFLNIREKLPRVWKWMMVWIGIRILSVFATDYDEFAFTLLLYFDYIPFIVAYFSAIYSYQNGFKPAIYFTLGFSVLLCSFVINSLRVACVIESNIFTAYSLNFGAVIEILFLSLALGTWLRQMIREKTFTEQMNRLLEEKVAERTEVLQMQNEIINEKVNELDTLFYRLSHDIKGPLKSILGLTNLGLVEVKERERYFKLIQDSANNLDKITTDFVQLTYIQQNDHESVSEIDFMELINNVLDSLRYIPDFNKMDIKIEINQNLTFRSHLYILNSIASNIVENAIKYRKSNANNSQLNIHIMVDEKKAKMLFSDNGIGINNENKSKVFGMFYREGLKDGVSGSGLGLYIVKKSLQKINGSISYQPLASGGSVFELEIPNTPMNVDKQKDTN